MENTAEKKQKPTLLIFFLIVVVAAVGFHLYSGGRFLTPSNIVVLLSHAVIPSFMAWGLAFIFACDFTDMSIGAVLILSATAAGVLGNQFGYPGVIIGGLGVGMILLTLNFLLFVSAKVPSWVAGIGMAMIYEAAAVFYSTFRADQGLGTVQLGEELRGLAKFPVIYIVFAIGLVVAYILYNRTQVGMNIRALGGGLDVARSLGIPVGRTLFFVGVIAGFFVGCAGFLRESYNASVTAQTSLSQIFQPMATMMLAKVLQSKINLIIGIPICALCVYGIFNILTILGVPSGTWQEAALGAIVLIFGVFAQRGVKGVVK